MPRMSFMRVAVTVGCTLTISLSGCSRASALTKPRRPHLVAQYGGGVRDWCRVAVLPTVITASRQQGQEAPGELHHAQQVDVDLLVDLSEVLLEEAASS